MNEAMKKYAEDVMNSPDRFVPVVNIQDKFLVFKMADPKYPTLHNMYIFLIWDERLGGYDNSMSEIEGFCRGHLDNHKFMLSHVKESYQVSSKGTTVVYSENKN